MSSAETPASGNEQPPSVHKRTYQACIPCRRRKVRCDLGSVDAPHDPPCVRCRREKKECFFTETRRKRKAGEDGEGIDEDYIKRNRRSMGAAVLTPDGTIDGEMRYGQEGGYEVHPHSRSGSGTQHDVAYASPFRGNAHMDGTLPPITAPKKITKGSETREVKNETAQQLFQMPINNPSDALHLLVDAASRSEDIERSRRESLAKAQTAEDRARPTSTLAIGQNASTAAIDPAILNATMQSPDYKEALKAWSKVRFVRAGWLTAREAISYIDYFYIHLAPLTPICPPDFSQHAAHSKLVADEPMLTVTLLTIASRYMVLPGTSGRSRSIMVHEKLWNHLQSMVTRMFWAQEQFGGGFCGAGASRTSEELDAKRRGLRSMGTIESLLLLSDWHPRSMHFPPGDDDGELTIQPLTEADEQEMLNGTSRNATTGWTEPALRSDRMCWSLVGSAYTLAFEIGIFDSMFENGKWIPGPQIKTSYDSQRADRIGRLLDIYVTQTAGRLGFPNMLAPQHSVDRVDYFKMDVPPGTYQSPYDAPEPSEKIQRAWAELTAIMRQTNAEMFQSKQQTRDRIQTGAYLGFLEAYGPRMKTWLERFESIQVPKHSKVILLMEYEYTRTYINSLSLQAVLEQGASITDTDGNDQTHDNKGQAGNGPQTPPAYFSSKLVDIYKRNAKYIAEVVDASRNLLKLVVDGLVPNNGLKHAPVRTHFRILSGAMFLLKTFALGGKEAEVERSLFLLDATVKALRDNVVDDVHISSRIADLLNGLTGSIRTKFVRLAVRKPKPISKSNTSAPSTASQNGGQTTSHQPESQGQGLGHSRRLSHTTHRHLSSSTDIVTSHNRASGPLAGIEHPFVDPNDPSITIMPPPDYIYPHSAFDSLYSPPPTTASNTLATYSPTFSQPPLQSPSFHAATSNPATPGFGMPSSVPPFSPGTHSTGSGGGGYDWLALDVNPLLNVNPAHGVGAAAGEAGVGAGTPMGQGQWSGAFGPELADSLEMLELLTADQWGQGGMDGGPGWV